MHQMPLLHDLVVLFGAALMVLVVSQWLRIPPVVGLLLSGILVGPSGLGLIEGGEGGKNIEYFAELGVVFLLFIIGLELNLERLKKLGRLLVVGGGLQAAGTAAVVLGLALALDFPFRQALFFGFVVALSSTAIVLKLVQDRGELDSPHGQATLGILLFQDFLIVPLLLMVPVLAGKAAASPQLLLTRFGGGLLVVLAAFLLGRFLLPRLLALVARSRIRELSIIGSLFACLGGALLTESLGFSLALGSFLAGLLIADSDFHYQVLAETASFRDVFTSIFFLSIGMLLSLETARQALPWVLGLSVGLVLLKALVVLAVVAILRYPRRTGIITALSLAQIGEFSFVLVKAGHDNELIPDTYYQIAVASAVLTMLATPALVAVAPRLAALVTGDRGLKEAPSAPLEGHVIIVGFGLSGRHLARVLKAARIPYRVVDLNPETVRSAQESGEPILFGDATRRDILESLGIGGARVVSVATSDARALHQTVRLARRLGPQAHIVARTRQLAEIEGLQHSGADEVISLEFESSIEIATRVLTCLHVPRNIVRAQARLLRQDGYQYLRSPAPVEGISRKAAEALAAGATDTFQVSSDHAAAGRTLKGLDLRNRTGATVIAVVRGDHPTPNPTPELRLEAGDVLVLVGSHAEIDAAFIALEGRQTDATGDPKDATTPEAG
jgi:CPA2 family monovalent cation:H+ antiporter-2